MDRTEQLIVERLKENDDKAWHYLFDRHYPVLCHIASRYVHDDFLAETIVGDVILHLQHWVSTKWPFAGRGPCGRPHPRWEIGYPAMADGHKGRALQEDRNVRLIIKGSTGSQYTSDEVGTCQCREGLHALPQIMFDLFFKTVGTFSSVVTFFSGCVIFCGRA